MPKLVLGEFISKSDYYEGKRILLDFMEDFGISDYVLIGNTNAGFVPVVCENHESANYKPRSFRFNVGALHQYIMTADNEIRYIAELTPGDCVLICREGNFVRYHIARIKKEMRPFCKLVFAVNDRQIEVVLQSNATACVMTDKGIKPIDDLRQGDKCYVSEWGIPTHLGTIKEEYCEEI